MDNIFRIENISILTQALNQGKPKHPLISVIDFSSVDLESIVRAGNQKAAIDFYCIMEKNLVPGSLKYGRKHYDFQEGSLFFMSPNQVFELESPKKSECIYGWGLFFHPDLIRGTSLGKKMSEYTFFEYDTNEALHVSEDEKSTLKAIVAGIDNELSRAIDKHSKSVIASNIELLLNHCMRFYDRQFITRNEPNKDIISDFERYLRSCFDPGNIDTAHLPTVKQCADEMHLSPNYLTDLLKKETGKNTIEHIHYFVLEEAKNRLLGSSSSVSEIAYGLGFEYPQYFNKLFKKNLGMTPMEFRNLN